MPKERILVVDDEYLIRWSLQQELEKEGYEVAVAEDGESALRMVREAPPDLVLLDIQLPGIGGIEVLQRIKAAELHLGAQGVTVESLNEDVRREEERCIHCGTCEGFCPTGALAVERPSMQATFNDEKCVLCERCLTACPTHAMVFRFS